MNRPRRAAPRQRPDAATLRDGVILVAGVAAGLAMMVVGWGSGSHDVPAPLPTAVVAAQLPSHGPDPTGAPSSAVVPAPPAAPPSSHPAAPPASDRAGPVLEIPAVGIVAPVDDVVVSRGALGIPDDPSRVGRWRGGASWHDPEGAILLTGHVAWRGARGTLWSLAAVEPGTEIRLLTDGSVSARWQVARIWAVERGTALPTLFRDDGPPTLAIVTCGGKVVDGHYTHNVIVEAEPLQLGAPS